MAISQKVKTQGDRRQRCEGKAAGSGCPEGPPVRGWGRMRADEAKGRPLRGGSPRSGGAMPGSSRGSCARRRRGLGEQHGEWWAPWELSGSGGGGCGRPSPSTAAGGGRINGEGRRGVCATKTKSPGVVRLRGERSKCYRPRVPARRARSGGTGNGARLEAGGSACPPGCQRVPARPAPLGLLPGLTAGRRLGEAAGETPLARVKGC